MEYYQLWDVGRRGELGINPEDDPVWMLGMVGVRFDHFSIYYINLLVNNIL
jgi:hypothetical protein